MMRSSEDELGRTRKKCREDMSSARTDSSVCVSYKSIVVLFFVFFSTNTFRAHTQKKRKEKENVECKMNNKEK